MFKTIISGGAEVDFAGSSDTVAAVDCNSSGGIAELESCSALV